MSEAILVGRKAPDFTAPAVNKAGEIIGQYNLAENIKGKYEHAIDPSHCGPHRIFEHLSGSHHYQMAQ